MIARIWVPDLDFKEMNRDTIYGHARLRFFHASPLQLMHDETRAVGSEWSMRFVYVENLKLCVVGVSVGCIGCTLKTHIMGHDEIDL
jgi:hypothetical protein